MIIDRPGCLDQGRNHFPKCVRTTIPPMPCFHRRAVLHRLHGFRLFFTLYVTLQSLLYNSSLSLSCFFVYPRILTIHTRGILLHKTNPYIRNLKNGKERPHGRRIYWRLSVVRIECAPRSKRVDVHMERLMIQVIRYRIAGVDGRKKRELVGRLEKTK